jgi:uncharacterized protein (TIGR02145 family)
MMYVMNTIFKVESSKVESYTKPSFLLNAPLVAIFHYRTLKFSISLAFCVLPLLLSSCTTFTAVDPDKLQNVSWADGESSSLVSLSSSSGVASSSGTSSVASSSSSELGLSYGTLVDTRGGVSKSYKTIVIHGQTWMAENLNFGTQAMGLDSVASQSNDAKVEKYCSGDNIQNCETDGGLYQWAEAMALSGSCNSSSCNDSINPPHQGICPAGWRIPSAADWDSLANYLGSADSAGAKMKLYVPAYPGWNATGSNDGNSSGFSTRPAGLLFNDVGFDSPGASAHFWVATEGDFLNANYRSLEAGKAKLISGNDFKTYGFSVRCLSDVQ